MPTPDEEFIKRLRATFQIEAEEHLQAIAAQLLALEKSQSTLVREAAIETMYREAHSLKGAARAVDMGDIESVCQALEGIFSKWKRSPIIPSPSALDILHKSLDIMHLILGDSGKELAGHVGERETLLSQLKGLDTVGLNDGKTVTGGEKPVTEKIPGGSSQLTSASLERIVETETVRISIAKLDAQLLHVEDLLPFKGLSGQRIQELHELMALTEQWQTQWAKVSLETRAVNQPHESGKLPSDSGPIFSKEMANFLEWNADFHRSLENKLRSLTAQTERDRHSISKRLDELLEDSKKLLMLPFSTFAAIFPKIIRDLCREQGKEAELVIRGSDVEVDKRILEEMKDAFIHILRNCVDHGIEAPAERARHRKQPSGTITIAVSQVNGSKVEIEVSDDGGGIDLNAIKETTVRRGLRSTAEMASLNEADALALVFDSEVSTRKIVTSVSGRGLGMAIVRSKVEKLGGHISLESKLHAGTTLRILLPLTLSTFRGILVSAADQTFVIPTANVEHVFRIRPGDIQMVENRETIAIEGRIFSLVRLAAVLELSMATRTRDATGPLPVLILRAGGERIAFAVDEVLHEEEVLVKPLRKPLVRVRNIGGATILGSGKAVATLNINDLIKSARIPRSATIRSELTTALAPPAKRVLVVEDSITSRMLLKGILESANYHVEVAVDGMDGFTRLREEAFDAVVSDVEMPRLNGFDLTAKIRADKRLADLPVVLVTALESRSERERGIDVGANAYIIKSSFDQSNLLNVIGKLL